MFTVYSHEGKKARPLDDREGAPGTTMEDTIYAIRRYMGCYKMLENVL